MNAEELPGIGARGVRRLGWLCGGLALALWMLSLPLGCAGRAALVGGSALLFGAALGTLLALVTRARQPLLIYAALLACLVPLGLLASGWPPASPYEIRLWKGAPDLLTGYFDILRLTLFLLGFPYPFARFGHHAPDSLPKE
jgi:hypothetical protein